MRQLYSNWVEYSVIPCLFHFLSFPVPIPSSGRQRVKQRLKVRKNPYILLHITWIQPLLLSIRFQTTEVLESGSEGGRKAGKNVLLNVNSKASFIYFIVLLSLSLATAGVGDYTDTLWRHHSCMLHWPFLTGPPLYPQLVCTPALITPSFSGPPFSHPRSCILLPPLTEPS